MWNPELVTAAVFWLLAASVNYGCALLGILVETGMFLGKVTRSDEKLTWNCPEGPVVDK